MKISICCPSYKRPKVETLDYLPFIRIYVDHKEAEKYEKANPGACIVSCPEGIQGNLSRVRNYILDTEFENGADVIGMADDDLKGVYYWKGKKEHLVTTDMFLPFVEKHTILAQELGAFLWGINVNQDKQVYREYSPFSTLSFPYGPLRFFVKDEIRIRHDERLPLKDDYDMFLQQVNIHRKVLRLNKYFCKAKLSEQAGGNAVFRNIEKEKSQFDLFQKKWGGRDCKKGYERQKP